MSSISPELWRRIEPIVEQAFELEGEERARLLDHACGDDRELRREVEKVLAADDGAGSFLSRGLPGLVPAALKTPLASAEQTLALDSTPDSASGSTPDSTERYAPGTVIADRFRIVTWLGRGGMGEVYRADDLKLGQAVALKFLPSDAEQDGARLELFLNEVRMALKVSHPNVTRIHDVVEVDGHHFLSMQYVDGEDLASLLRRIGRLPRDKAVQVARQLCAGLAAAHDQGVLHRDLKPANVMIDGRGQVKVTDFGLAVLDEGADGAVAGGTAEYMAPEQWAGRRPTRQSDLYSLGLVLYELFTGRSAFRGQTPGEIAAAHRDGSSTDSPSTLIEDFDPAIERIILRCLEAEPAKRPHSALEVAAALPGGDPLAAALAAGETPSPEMVAQAVHGTQVSRRHAWATFAVVVVLLGLAVSQVERYQLIGAAALDKPPAVLTHQAREILDALGYDEPPADHITFFEPDRAYLRHVERTDPSLDRWQKLRQSQPSAYRFWYRQSPRELARLDPSQVRGERSDPPLDQPGMVEVALDSSGRLLALTAVPATSAADVGADPSTPDPVWLALLEVAGLEVATLTEAAPLWTPPVFAHHRRAWVGVFPQAPEVPLRVEAAGYRGRPVYFRVLGPWERPETGAPTSTRPFEFLYSSVLLAAMLSAALAAVRNLRRGRGDLKTARRLALLVFGLRLSWLLAAHHFSGAREIALLTAHLAQAALLAATIWLFYLSVEPHARRLWPRILTTWVRLFEGRLLDPLVGRDILIGVAAGLVNSNLRIFTQLVLDPAVGQAPRAPFRTPWSDVALGGVPETIAALVAMGPQRMVFMFGFVVLITLFRLITGRTWAALLLASALVILGSFPGGNPTTYLINLGLGVTLTWTVLLRVGLVAFVSMHSVLQLAWNMPLTTDPASWYFGSSLATLAFIVGLASWGLYRWLAGSSLLAYR